jgi:hypothetical protein
MEKQKEYVDLEDSNKLIAEFMGYEYTPYSKEAKSNGNFFGWRVKGFNDRYTPLGSSAAKIAFGYNIYLGRTHEELSFHRDWNRLMPVVEKIEQPDYDYFVHILGNGAFITTNNPELYRDGSSEIVGSTIIKDSKIMSVYIVITEFIKWYNKTNK